MRQVILASAYGTSAGQVSYDTKNFVLNRTAAQGGNILYPYTKTDLTIVKSKAPAAAVQMSKTFTISEVEKDLVYTIVFVKKGVQFNEKNTWTFTTRANGAADESSVGEEVVKWAKANKATLGLTVTNNSGVLTIKGPATGEDYEIKGADELIGVVATGTAGKPAFMYEDMVKDLLAKGAADAGFEYTEEADGLYPNYPAQVTAGAYVVFTLRFTEPRNVGTKDEKVYQLLQIVVPSAAASALQTELAKLGTVVSA